MSRRHEIARWVGLAATALSVVGCTADETVAPVPRLAFRGTLAVDIRGTADVDIDAKTSEVADIRVAIDAATAKGVFDAREPLVATGRIERFPETRSELFTATFSRPPAPGGACADAPITLTLALHRRDPNLRFGGSLTTYCGQGITYGVPARIFRLSGQLAPR